MTNERTKNKEGVNSLEGVFVRDSPGKSFPEWVTLHTKRFANPKFEYPLSWVTKRVPKAPGDLFRVEGPQSRDADEYGPTRHIHQFHRVISQCWPNLVH